MAESCASVLCPLLPTVPPELRSNLPRPQCPLHCPRSALPLNHLRETFKSQMEIRSLFRPKSPWRPESSRRSRTSARQRRCGSASRSVPGVQNARASGPLQPPPWRPVSPEPAPHAARRRSRTRPRRPATPCPGHSCLGRKQAPSSRAFEVWEGGGGEGRGDEHLPQPGPWARLPPSDSVGGADTRADGPRPGPRRGAARAVSPAADPTVCGGNSASPRAF